MCFPAYSRQGIAWRTENQLLDVAPGGFIQEHLQTNAAIVQQLQPSSRQRGIWSTYCPLIENKWVLSTQSAQMSVKLMQKDFCKCFYVKDVLHWCSQLYWVYLLEGIPIFLLAARRSVVPYLYAFMQGTYMNMLACPWLGAGKPCAAPHACYIECVYIVAYKYAALRCDPVSY